MSRFEHNVKIYFQGSGPITAPIVVKPAKMSRKEWRALRSKARHVVKKHLKEQAHGKS